MPTVISVMLALFACAVLLMVTVVGIPVFGVLVFDYIAAVLIILGIMVMAFGPMAAAVLEG